MKEPLEKYLEAFDVCRDTFESLLETTVDLTQLSENAMDVLTNKESIEALRYLPGPPISLDDLKTVAETPSIARRAIQADPEIAQRLIDTVLLGLDRQRFPWLSEGREATEKERTSAVLATAAMIASKRVETTRRNEGKTAQEKRVKDALIDHGFSEVVTRQARNLAEAPGAGEFCGESLLGTRKADLLVGLWDRRVMPIECKVSNSATNSIKRLNNDAAVKAETWRGDFGVLNVVPVAVLSGVYNLRNLRDAQDRGLTLFWAHDLEKLTAWIDTTN